MTEQKLYCPICKKETYAQGKPDDVGTQFYKCENGHQTTKAINQEEKKLHYAFEVQAEQNGEKYVNPLNPMSAFCDEKGAFKPALVAEYLTFNEHFKTDRQTGILYFGDQTKGKWAPNGEVFLQEILAKLLGIENRASHYNNILHDLKGLTYTDTVFSKKIAVENGLLDVETGELTPFTLDEMAFYSIPVTYNPQSKKCDNWLEFLNQVVNPEDILTLQEWAGYVLLPDYRFHKVLWINGEGRNGKGVFDRTIQGILGRENFASVGLEELDGNHRFSLNRLYGKLYNTSSEPATNRFFKTEIFQKISGCDPIDAERKGKDETLKFVNCAKLTIIGNKFPKVRNPTTAFKERMMFIKFPNFIETKNRIPNLEQVWLSNPEEKSAIFNWMLEGLHRLLSQGYFTESKTQHETEIEFQKTSDTIGAFLTEMAVFDKRIVTTRGDAFEKYKDYCEVFGLEAENEKTFTARLKETPKISVTTVSKPKRERAWKGLGLKQLDDEGIVTVVTDVTGQIPLTLSENLKNGKDITRVTGVTGVTEETYPKRYCSTECSNFDKPTCTAPNWQSLNQESALPLKCPGYSYVGAGEEVS